MTTSRPEGPVLVVLAAYSERYRLTITPQGRMWTVTSDDLKPRQTERYTDLVSWLGLTFGSIR